MNNAAAAAAEGLNLLSQTKAPITAALATDCQGQPLLFTDLASRQELARRIYGLVPGYEDRNDRDQRRRDALLAAAGGKVDLLGGDQFDPAHRGVALAGAATFRLIGRLDALTRIRRDGPNFRRRFPIQATFTRPPWLFFWREAALVCAGLNVGWLAEIFHCCRPSATSETRR